MSDRDGATKLLFVKVAQSMDGGAGAFLVDLDGTMVDTLGDFVAVLHRVALELGLPLVGRDFVERTVGRGSEHLIRTVLAELGADAGLYEQAWHLYQIHYAAENGRHSSVYPGVVEGLRALRARGLPMVCLTNKPSAAARQLLALKGLDGFFDRVYGGDDFARKKPDPEPLLKTCAALGLSPERVWMIGDSANDAMAARAAGCPVILVRYGYNHGQPIEQAGADLMIDSLAELPGLLAAAPGFSRAGVPRA